MVVKRGEGEKGWQSNNANKPGQSASARGLHMPTQTPSPSLRGAAGQGWLGAGELLLVWQVRGSCHWQLGVASRECRQCEGAERVEAGAGKRGCRRRGSAGCKSRERRMERRWQRRGKRSRGGSRERRQKRRGQQQLNGEGVGVE